MLNFRHDSKRPISNNRGPDPGLRGERNPVSGAVVGRAVHPAWMSWGISILALASMLGIHGHGTSTISAQSQSGSSIKTPTGSYLRRPVSAVFLTDDRTLCIANQSSGSLSLVDVERGELIGEWKLARSLVSLATLPNRTRLLALDETNHELLLLHVTRANVRVESRLPVSPGAIHVVATLDGRRAVVAALWSHCVEILDLNTNAGDDFSPHVRHRVALPFAPRLQCLTPDGQRVIVADGFGGGLAIVELASGKILASQELNGHNTRGLILSPDGEEIVLAQQILNEHLPTTQENIERGRLMQNVLRVLPLNSLLQAGQSVARNDAQSETILRLGEFRAGAGDPAGVAWLKGDRLVVALSGVQQVAVVSHHHSVPVAMSRTAVGQRPVAVIPRPGTSQVAVLNQLDDSVSLVDVDQRTVERTISLGAQPSLLPKDRGEHLFFDARLSRDGWLSCHSCHPDGHSNGRRADTLGDNSFGTPKRTLTLLGTAFTYRWAWNGEVVSLHDQVRKSLVDSMHGAKINAEEIRDIVSYLHTLAPPPPMLPLAVDAADQASIVRGKKIFETQHCQNCHIPPIVYASHESYDVGLTDERGLSKFNPPSLRGVSQGTRYFHDNRAESLESVIEDYNHPGATVLNRQDLADLVRFLKSI
ncbi:MAG: cytochrome c peroxidase [Planctomycetaceae bacterium]|nr:cytochrome c peroxidase [Planctomycetaceae bacterium]